MGLSCECDFSPSKLLLPISYASILAGSCTLIGTSTNIIISDLSAGFGFEPLSMFELSQVGIPIAIVGILFLFFVSPRILPGNTVLLGIILLSSLCTHILSNNATAVLLLPIVVSTATSLGVDPRPFIIGICFGASACFATPIGYQTNLLVYGPGRYRFSDYIKLGMPLNIMVIGLSALLIPLVWPF